MAIIYTYPKLSNPTGSELVLISDTDNNTKQVTISNINDLVDCVKTLNGFSGQVNIVGGDNITVDPITGTNQIQINSDVDASGLNGELSYFAGDGKTLRGQDLLTYDGTRLFLSNYFWHKDNVTGNNAFFGFNNDNSFLVYLDEGAQERIELANDKFRMFTGKTPKIAGYSDSVAIFNEMITKAQPEPESQVVIRTTERGFKVSTTYKSGTAVDSDLGFGGQIQFAASQDAGRYVGIMGPISSELTANYNLMLPNKPGTSGQLLAVGDVPQGTPPNQYRKLEWIDGGEAVGVTKVTAGSGITLNPSSGIGEVEITASATGSIGGSGVANQLAFFDDTDSITSSKEIQTSSTYSLKLGDRPNKAGLLILDNDGSSGGSIRLHARNSTDASNRYINIYSGEEEEATPYDLYFPPNASPAPGRVLTSKGANGKLEWAANTDTNTNVANSNLTFNGSWNTTIGNNNKWSISALTPLPTPDNPTAGELLINVAGGVDFGDVKPGSDPVSVSMVTGAFNYAQNNWVVSATGTNPSGGTGWPASPALVDIDLSLANVNYFKLSQDVNVNLINAKVGASYKIIVFYQEPGFKLTLSNGTAGGLGGGTIEFPNSSTFGNLGNGTQISSTGSNHYDIYDLYCVTEYDPSGTLGLLLATQSLNY